MTSRLTGKVEKIGVYPINVNKQSMYEVISFAKVSDINVKYGMQGNATIVTGRSTYRSTYFKYFLDKVLNKR